MPREITAFSNPLVKQVRALRDKKHRREAGLFVAEGLRILVEARETGRLPRILFYGAGTSHPLLSRLVEDVEAAGGDVIETNADILHKLTGKDNPQTVLGVFEQFDLALERIDRNAAPLWIVAQALRDPGNLGTILRTGDAVAAGGLILVDDCADPFSVEAVRASMGALFTQRIAAARWDRFIAWLRSGAGELIGTSLGATADYRAARYRPPTFLLIGNEAQGLPAAYEAECDMLVKIPMLGKADSLNAAIATGVLAYEVVNQWRA
ncbi:MAG TPA: RNA methyltransferase, partial [Allosphingosinicella sp.]|jgi:TrmH family RNA methyltransferase